MADEKPTYDSTQEELYSIDDTINNNLEDNLGDFALHKVKYDAAYVLGLRANRTAAMTLPTIEIRRGNASALRTELVERADLCLANFGALKSYIDDSYVPAQHKIRYNQAGQAHFAKASNDNWEEVVGLNTAMKGLITDQLGVLQVNLQTGGGNMPLAFQGKVISDSSKFDDKYAEFKAARLTGVATGLKIIANNVVDADMKSIEADSEVVYKDNADMRKLFSIPAIKDIVSPPGSASLKVGVKKDVTNVVQPNKRIVIQTKTGVAIELVTDEFGEVHFKDVDPGVYNVKVFDGATLLDELEKDVNTGVNARLEIVIP